MGKALMGTHVTSDPLRLLDEVRVLRQRVAELEAALDEAMRARPADDAGRPDGPTLHTDLDRDLDTDREPAAT